MRSRSEAMLLLVSSWVATISAQVFMAWSSNGVATRSPMNLCIWSADTVNC